MKAAFVCTTNNEIVWHTFCNMFFHHLYINILRGMFRGYNDVGDVVSHGAMPCPMNMALHSKQKCLGDDVADVVIITQPLLTNHFAIRHAE